MKANYEDKIKPTSAVTLGNLYDMNKQLMEQEDELNDKKIKEKHEELYKWLSQHYNQKYFMLLCHELRDYTLFNLNKTDSPFDASDAPLLDAAYDVIECMTNRGDLIACDLQNSGAWELWIRNREGCFAYYLFPYGDAVLEY